MSTPDPLAELARRGLSVSIVPDGLLLRPKAAITDEVRGFVRDNREAITRALQEQQASPAEARRQKVLDQLAEAPSRRYAVLADDSDSQSAYITLAVAIREADGQIITCELRALRQKYDPMRLLELVEAHGAALPTIH